MKIQISIAKSKKVDLSSLQRKLKSIGLKGVVDNSSGFSNKTIVFSGNTKIATISENGSIRVVGSSGKSYKEKLRTVVEDCMEK
jgi:hypothetical protein